MKRIDKLPVKDDSYNYIPALKIFKFILKYKRKA